MREGHPSASSAVPCSVYVILSPLLPAPNVIIHTDCWEHVPQKKRKIEKNPVFLTTTRNVFTKISLPKAVSSEKLMEWSPISRGSRLKVTKWVEEPSIVWRAHLEDLEACWLPVEPPDVQIPSAADILTQNWNTAGEELYQRTSSLNHTWRKSKM